MDIETRKAIYNFSLSLATLLVTAIFWRNIWLTVLLLFLFGILMMRIENDKSVIFIYTVSFIFGALSEILVINVGSAWQYTSKQIFGIPFWLPFIWGNVGLFINRLNLFVKYLSNRF